MTGTDAQMVARRVAASMSGGPDELVDVLAPGVTWSVPDALQVVDVEAGEDAVLVSLRRVASAAPDHAVDAWRMLRLDGGRVVEVLDVAGRDDALGYMNRLR